MRKIGKYEKKQISEPDVIEFINSKLTHLGIPLSDGKLVCISSLADLESINEIISTKSGEIGNANEDKKGREIDQSYKWLCSQTIGCLQSIDFWNRAIKLDRSSKSRLLFPQMLETGVRWLEDDPKLEICPFCLNRISREETIKLNKSRLEESSELVQLEGDLKAYRDELYVYASELKKHFDVLLIQAKADDRIDIVESVLKIKSSVSDYLNAIPLSVKDLILCDGKFVSFGIDVSNISLWIEDYRCKILEPENVEKYREFLRVKSEIAEISRDWNEFLKLESDWDLQKRKLDTLTIMISSVQSSRIKKLNMIFDSISDQIQKYYETIHPNENHKPFITSTDNKRGAMQGVDIKANFYSESKVHPKVYFSEGHLDTLGICIFLALHMREVNAERALPLLILDDVLSSIDMNHRIRMTNLLLMEFKDHQIVLTTHSKTWLMKIKEVLLKNGISDRYLIRKIASWSIERGPTLDEYYDEYDFLKKCSIDGYIGIAASAIGGPVGKLMEGTLCELRRSLRLSAPGRPDDLYTIGDLWPVFFKSSQLCYEYNNSFKQEIGTVNQFWTTRNDLDHDRSWDSELSENEAHTLAEAVTGWYDTVFCSKCGELICDRIDFWQCGCGELKYRKKVQKL